MTDIEAIVKDIKNRQFKPIYFLMGDEPYYIDQISNYIAEHVLDETQKDFNQTILYGLDTDPQTIVSEAKRFPMMCDHQVVIVKEAQHVKNLVSRADTDVFKSYCENPLSSTILVICYKMKKLNRNTKLAKAIIKNGLLFESPKIKDYHMDKWISAYITKLGFTVGPKASMLLAAHLGNDLGKVVKEIEKLTINLSQNASITEKLIETNTGISKDYNIFELQNALSRRDVVKANRIINYFAQNPKEHPIYMTLPGIYSYFSKIFQYHFMKEKQNDKKVAGDLRIHPFIVSEYRTAARNYPNTKVRRIFSYLHETDVKSKGVDNTSVNHGDLMKELMYKILH